MRLKDLIRAPKRITDDGSKLSSGKMPKSAFPLSKNSGYTLGSGWDWRVVRFDAIGEKCRLLAAYHAGKVNYVALLGIERGIDMTVVARLEYHSLHKVPGWHVHTKCEDHNSLVPGVIQGPTVKRLPAANSYHRQQDCGNVTASNLLAPAFKYFRIDQQ